MNIYINLCLLLTLSCISLVAMDNSGRPEKSLSQCLKDALSFGSVGGLAIAQMKDDSRELVQVDTDLEALSKKEVLELDEQLLVAAVLGKHENVIALMRAGANPQIQTKIRKETPLMYAVRKGDSQCVNALLAILPEEQTKIQNAWGFTALDMAVSVSEDKLIPLLVQAGADVNSCPCPRPTDTSNKKGVYPYLAPLALARYESTTKTVEALIACGAKDNEKK